MSIKHHGHTRCTDAREDVAMVYKCKVTKTYYRVRRGLKVYRYVKLIVNLPLDEKLLNVDYVYVLTPDEYENLRRNMCNDKQI